MVSDLNKDSLDEGDEHRLMINISRGPLGIYSHLFENPSPTVIVADFPLSWTTKTMLPLLKNGIRLWVPSQRAIPAHLMDPKIKNRSRLFYQMANIQVSEIKGERVWALLVDPNGYIAEGTGSNIFFVKDGMLITPKPENLLRGISRSYVIELAAQLGIEVREQNVELFDAYDADEAFMTGTPFCMLPVTTLNSLPIGNGKKGPVFEKLLNRWSKNVGLDIEKQIKAFNAEMTSTGSGASPYKFTN
jgi:branched-chain amino acid aminotransferase